MGVKVDFPDVEDLNSSEQGWRVLQGVQIPTTFRGKDASILEGRKRTFRPCIPDLRTKGFGVLRLNTPMREKRRYTSFLFVCLKESTSQREYLGSDIYTSRHGTRFVWRNVLRSFHLLSKRMTGKFTIQDCTRFTKIDIK